MNRWQERDLNHIWHPCSQMKDYDTLPPIVIERGEGVWLYDTEGRRYLDAIASWWVNLFGHRHPRLNSALNRQLQQLEQVIFANFSHPPAITLAERIVELAPEGLTKVFFADNGSAAVEVALKLSFQYHQQTGNPQKNRFVAVTDAYHGETLGALAVGDLDLYSQVFKPIMQQTHRVNGPDCYRCRYRLTREECDAPCIESMEQLLEERHDEVCAVIIEPLIQAAAGMKIYPPIYLKKLRDFCTNYQVHLIADEIAVGFGRTGTMFACEQAGIAPDLMCLSKGLTAGYLPLSLVLTTRNIYDAFYHEYTELKAFMHSHSYTGNPLACAVAVESLNIFRDENILEKNQGKLRRIGELARAAFQGHPYLGEFRQLGMVGALELVEDPATKRPFDWRRRVGYEISKIALREGLMLRPLGNVIYFMPPYVISEEEIEMVVNGALRAIEMYFGRLQRS